MQTQLLLSISLFINAIFIFIWWIFRKNWRILDNCNYCGGFFIAPLFGKRGLHYICSWVLKDIKRERKDGYNKEGDPVK